MDVNVQIMNTVREEDGLAMSSRNAYLSEEEREKAHVVYNQCVRTPKEMLSRRRLKRTAMVLVPKRSKLSLKLSLQL
jgi:pantothenate synthetase